MAALGLGFLTSNLRRHSWSSVAFNLFMLALGVQWAMLLDGFLSQFPPGKVVITLFSIRLATMSAMSVLISAGAVLGKVNLVQLVVMVLVEVTAFGTMRMVISNIFKTDCYMNLMHFYVFAAYFGLTVAWCLPKPLPKGTEDKDQRATIPSLSAMLGPLFLWMFWPSVNSALLRSPIERKNAVFNTYYALAVSAVTAISVSSLAHPQGKISMTYVHSAVLAGGVAVGTSCHLIPSPWLAMVLGLVAGLISIGGAKCVPVYCNQVLGIHDSSGVHYNFSLLGLLGEITYIVLVVRHTVWNANGMIGFQVLLGIGEFSLAIAIALTSGLLTGLLLNLKIWKAPHVAKYFDDQVFWKYDASLEDQKGLVASYQVGQDLTVMAAIGFGFLTSSFRRHSWSSVAFNLFMLALGVQWAILLDGFLSQFPPGKVVITLFRYWDGGWITSGS
ncbi:blood group Rh(CE) polypeptide isoform X1 [Pan paniscus]|uniref:blood group Rh(CE) polypeptide isoform X1 n=1 Tax=Pan paniscus TaxID=9597 RepID=UPI0025464CB5|nr:blood group Rh(CE) polypeptide isoform X1 [Pan paniscus]